MALALCDPGDDAILLAPYYFSHKLALQIAQATVRTCNWDPRTLLPDLQVSRRRRRRRRRLLWFVGWRQIAYIHTPIHTFTTHQHLEVLLAQGRGKVRLVLLTTPGNPTGAVCPLALQRQILALCRRHNAWLVVDETYEHFLHDGAKHVSLCAERCVVVGCCRVWVWQALDKLLTD